MTDEEQKTVNGFEGQNNKFVAGCGHAMATSGET